MTGSGIQEFHLVSNDSVEFPKGHLHPAQPSSPSLLEAIPLLTSCFIGIKGAMLRTVAVSVPQRLLHEGLTVRGGD